MRFSRLLFVIASLVPVLVCLASAEDVTYIPLYNRTLSGDQYPTCSGDNYTSNSIYHKNLNNLLSSLSSNKDITYGFYNFSEGQGTDRVNAIALCRGDISQTECQRCLSFSTTDLPRQCPSGKEAIVWYDQCMLRYSDKSIFGSLDESAFFMWNPNNVSDVDLFSQRLNDLLSKLRRRASEGDSRVKFAVGDTSYTNSTRIYGLVQCTPDLSEVQCSNCLKKSFGNIDVTFPGKRGGRVIGPSCNFRYEIGQFYEIPSPPSSPGPPSPAIAPPPHASTNIATPTGGGSNKVQNIIIAAVSTVYFMTLISTW